MLPLERQNKIVELIQKNLTVKVVELSKLFNVTEETVRKDLEKLEKLGVVKRSYGGAILAETITETKEVEDPSFTIRATENREAKSKIGKAVASILKHGEIVMMDSSTTCLEIAKNIEPTKKVTVITNGISIISEMSSSEEATIVSTGGTLRSKALSLVGPTAKNNIENYYADKAIISCRAIDEKRGGMDSNELETEIKKAMIACAKEVVLVVNSTKLGKASLYKVIEFNKINYLVIDKIPDEKWIGLCDKFGINLILAE